MKNKSYFINLLSFGKKVYEIADLDDNYEIIYLDSCKALNKVAHGKNIRFPEHKYEDMEK